MFSKRLKHLVYKHMYGGSVPDWVEVSIREALPRLLDYPFFLTLRKLNEHSRTD